MPRLPEPSVPLLASLAAADPASAYLLRRRSPPGTVTIVRFAVTGDRAPSQSDLDGLVAALREGGFPVVRARLVEV